MGMLINGRWNQIDAVIKDGHFERAPSAYASGLGGDIASGLRANPGRYLLIASLSCPWSHRTLMVRRLKSLTECVPLQIAGGPRAEGYALNGGKRWVVPGRATRIRHLHELYALADGGYTGRATVPVLWDSAGGSIVSNDSAEIMRAFDQSKGGEGLAFTLKPPALRSAVDELNDQLHEGLFNAVYRAGFARVQAAYDDAVEQVFATLDNLEKRLADRRYLFGPVITETDWRLFATLVRFDVAYHGHFKCARRRLVDYRHLWAYARDLHGWRGMADTLDFRAIRHAYYGEEPDINPFRIIPIPPDIDWTAPHGRDRLGAARVALVNGDEIEVNPSTLRPLDGEAAWTH